MLIQSYVCKRVFSFFSPYVRDYRHISFTRLKYFWGSMIIFILSTSKHGPAQDHGAEAAAEAGGRGARGAEANKKKDAAAPQAQAGCPRPHIGHDWAWLQWSGRWGAAEAPPTGRKELDGDTEQHRAQYAPKARRGDAIGLSEEGFRCRCSGGSYVSVRWMLVCARAVYQKEDEALSKTNEIVSFHE